MDIVKEIEERIAYFEARMDSPNAVENFKIRCLAKIAELEWVLDMLKQQQAGIDWEVDELTTVIVEKLSPSKSLTIGEAVKQAIVEYINK
uniref:Uncharacterized protein n=1 Tax=viral metagenome TaxID=1070528 RepID=A0A6M3JIY3_9ZZZZ